MTTITQGSELENLRTSEMMFLLHIMIARLGLDPIALGPPICII